MRFIFFIALLATVLTAPAQHAAEAALEKDSKSLKERFSVMKEKSQTYNDYKVIKETILDAMWKMTLDSISQLHAEITETRYEVSQLQNQLSAALAEVKHKEESMEEIVFASTHINVLGIDMSKKFFIGFVGIVVAGLLLLLGLISGRLKMMYYSLKEKIEVENLISSEFENYKRKALEKQMKLSRELQNERNKMSEMKSA